MTNFIELSFDSKVNKSWQIHLRMLTCGIRKRGNLILYAIRGKFGAMRI